MEILTNLDLCKTDNGGKYKWTLYKPQRLNTTKDKIL